MHNDFHATRGIFPIFDGLQVQDMDKPLHDPSADLPAANGEHQLNGANGETKKTASEEKQDQSLLDVAKSAAVEVTNGLKSLAVSN